MGFPIIKFVPILKWNPPLITDQYIVSCTINEKSWFSICLTWSLNGWNTYLTAHLKLFVVRRHLHGSHAVEVLSHLGKQVLPASRAAPGPDGTKNFHHPIFFFYFLSFFLFFLFLYIKNGTIHTSVLLLSLIYSKKFYLSIKAFSEATRSLNSFVPLVPC